MEARELKTLNRSMFAVHVKNPFNSAGVSTLIIRETILTSIQRARDREEQVLENAQRDRNEREGVRAAAWGNNARQAEVTRDLAKMSMGGKPKPSAADRRYALVSSAIYVLTV
jgi:protein transport protein SEC9